ncbi:MAG: hypothetical protein LBG58_06040 [Planctomycetaceae bacterium]|jgi:hypothetical protein|nr:hypothetical protein [Planctomycetaceae bacterium]
MTHSEKSSHVSFQESELDSLWESFKKTLQTEVDDCKKLGFYNRRGFLKTIVTGAIVLGTAGGVIFST